MAVVSLLGCYWPIATETTPLAALVTKFDRGPPTGIVQANGGTITLMAVLAIKFSGKLPAGILLADGSADDTIGNHGHQRCWWDLCRDAAG